MEGDRVGYRELFQNRRFALAITSDALGTGGYAVYEISILWLSYHLSGSLAVAGLVLLVEFGVYALTFVAGPSVDRTRDLRTILLLGYIVQAICAFAIGLTLTLGLLTIPLLLVLVAAISLVWDFTWTADNALIPRIVPERQLFRANGLAGAVSGGNTIAGFAAGGGLILLVGATGGMYLYAVLNAAAALVVLPLSVPAVHRLTTGILEDFWEGWRELARGRGRPLFQIALYSTVQGLFSSAPPLLITLLASQRFANPTTVYGVLFTAYTIGSVVGGLLLGQANPRRHITLLIIAGPAAQGVLILAAVLAVPSVVPSLVLWFAVGLVGMTFYSGYLVYLQARIPPDRFGRVLTNLYLFRGIPIAVGAGAIGVLAGLWGPTTLAIVIAVFYVTSAVLGPILLPGIRKLGF